MALRIFVAHPSALLTDHRPHGDGLVAHGVLAGLAARGHELHVAVQAADLTRPLPANVHLHPVGRTGGGPAASRLGFMWRTRRLLERLVTRVPFDLVHQLNPVDAGLSLAVAGMHLPVVLGPYVPDWPGRGPGADGEVAAPVRAAKGLVRGAQQRRAALVLLSTPAAAGKLARPGRSCLVRELSPGIDLAAWPVAPPDPGTQDVLFLANLHRRKGIHVLLDAWARTAAQLPAARLVVAGGGPEEAAVRRRVRDEPGLARVDVAGPLGRDAVGEAMRACSLYCLPSFGEPFGMSALEAMASGRPVVATAAGGLGHLVPPGGGRLVPPGDPAALSAALTELLADPGLRRRMGEENRRAVEEHRSWPRVIDRLEAAYAEVLGSVRPVAGPG